MTFTIISDTSSYRYVMSYIMFASVFYKYRLI